jgi:hypothetical protein
LDDLRVHISQLELASNALDPPFKQGYSLLIKRERRCYLALAMFLRDSAPLQLEIPDRGLPILVCEHERIFIAEKSRAQPPAWHATSRINIKRALCYLITNLQQT